MSSRLLPPILPDPLLPVVMPAYTERTTVEEIIRRMPLGTSPLELVVTHGRSCRSLR